MATANLLRRSDDIDLARLVLILSETVKRLEDKVDMLIIQRADEAPDTGAITLHHQNSAPDVATPPFGCSHYRGSSR